MPRFWAHIDWLIPDDKKKTITDEEAKRRTENVKKSLNQIQTRKIKKLKENLNP